MHAAAPHLKGDLPWHVPQMDQSSMRFSAHCMVSLKHAHVQINNCAGSHLAVRQEGCIGLLKLLCSGLRL